MMIKYCNLPLHNCLGRTMSFSSRRCIHKPIGVADYELTQALPQELASSLPSIEEIEAELSADLQGQDEEEG